MNKPIRREAKKPKPVVEVIKNSLSREEADAIVDNAVERGGPFMTLAETLAHAARMQQSDTVSK